MEKEDKIRGRSLLDLARYIEPEALLWAAALLALFFVDPYSEQHFSFCIFHNMGIESCPGCGLGRSIALLYRGELVVSLSAHPLGIVTLGVILSRIAGLMRRSYNHLKNKPGGRHGRFASVAARNSGR